MKNFTRALQIAQAGFGEWAAKPHNAKWVRKIDGTPIPNDLIVCIAEAFANAALARPEPLTVPEASANGGQSQ